MAIHIHTEGDPAYALARQLASVIRAHGDLPILLLYSGGSALQVLTFLPGFLGDFDLSDTIFAPVDERNDIGNSNVEALKKSTVYAEFVRKGVTFVDLGDLGSDLRLVADRYNEQISVLFDDIAVHGGTILSLLGMGADGHTAGIFPYPEDPHFFENTFLNTDRYVVGYDVGEKNPYKERVTLTIPALLKCDYTFVYVSGEEKREILCKALNDGPMEEIPARLLQRLRNCELFTELSV